MGAQIINPIPFFFAGGHLRSTFQSAKEGGNQSHFWNFSMHMGVLGIKGLISDHEDNAFKKTLELQFL